MPVPDTQINNWVSHVSLKDEYTDGGIDKFETVFHTRLMSDCAAGLTTLPVFSIPKWMTANLGWIAIGVGSSTCEIRKFTARDGANFTVTATSNAHSVGDHVLFLSEPTINAKWFGATGDGSTDDYTAISNAVSAADAADFSRVLLPPGIYMTSAKLQVPHRVSIVGLGNGYGETSRSSVIKATSGFPSNTPVVELGVPGSSAFGTRLENVSVLGNGVAHTGIYSEEANEMSGLRRVYVADCTTYGVHFATTSAQHWFVDGLVVILRSTTGATSSSVGVYVNTASSSQRGINDYTFNTDNLVTCKAGLMLDAAPGFVGTRMHFENCTDGVLLGENTLSSACTLIGVLGNTDVTNLIHIASNMTGAQVVILNANKFGGTNNIVNDVSSETITSAIVPMYVFGDVRASGGFRQSIDDWYQVNVAASQSVVTLDRGSVDGIGVYNDTWLAVRNGSITGVGVRTTEARTAGTLTVEAYTNGVATGLTAVLDATNATFKATYQDRETDAFSAGDRITLRITTDGSWAPTTADIRAFLEVET